MEWFEKHLNWTALIAWLVAVLIVTVVQFVLVATDNYLSSEELLGVSVIVCLLVLPVSWGWVLRRRRRSLWWLLPALFFPFGFVLLFRLEDKTPPWYLEPQASDFVRPYQ